MNRKTPLWKTVSGFGATSVGGALVMSAAALGGDSLLAAETRMGGAGALLLAGVACTVQGCLLLRTPRANVRVSDRADASDASRPRTP